MDTDGVKMDGAPRAEETDAASDFGHDDSRETLARFFRADAYAFRSEPIEMLELSIRPLHCLQLSGVSTIGQLLSKTFDELWHMRNMGEKSVREIRSRLEIYLANPPERDFAADAAGTAGQALQMIPAFAEAVESLVMGKPFSADGLDEGQAAYLARLEQAADAAGADICSKIYHDPGYGVALCGAFKAFAAPWNRRVKAEEDARKEISLLPEQNLKALPFVRAYAAKAANKPYALLEKCGGDVLLRDLPDLMEGLPGGAASETLLNETGRFLRWLDFDPRAQIAKTANRILQETRAGTGQRLEVFRLRAEGKTLDEVGSSLGVTRERVRQIERNCCLTFCKAYRGQKYDILLLIRAVKNDDAILGYDELEEMTGSEFAQLLWKCAKDGRLSDVCRFSEIYHAIVLNAEASADEREILEAANRAIDSLPVLVEVSRKDALLGEKSEERGISLEILDILFREKYQQSGRIYSRRRLTITMMCEYVLKNRFPGGYKIADEDEGERFSRCLQEIFGDSAKDISLRTIDINVARVGVLIDRGRYLHTDDFIVQKSVTDAVLGYIERSPRAVLSYSEIFDATRDVLEGTPITNRYALQGALKKAGCGYDMGRDFIRKSDGVKFDDEVESFVERRGTAHQSEILEAFPSLRESALVQILSRNERLFRIANGYIIHASSFQIRPEDYDVIRPCLLRLCEDAPAPVEAVYNALSALVPEFLERNGIDDESGLFAILRYMFHGEFRFSRPYIAYGEGRPISARSVLLKRLEKFGTVEADDLLEICEESGIHGIGFPAMCKMIAPDFLRVSQTTFTRRELTGVTDEIAAQAAEILKEALNGREYIVGAAITDFLWYPQIRVPWNAYLLESVLEGRDDPHMLRVPVNARLRPVAVYVRDTYRGDSFQTFLVKILREEARKGSFMNKKEMRGWLADEGLIAVKLPKYLETDEYFYEDETGVREQQREHEADGP